MPSPKDFKPQPDLSRKKKILFYVLMVVLTLAAIEGGVRLLYFLRDWGAGAAAARRPPIPSEAGREWLKDLLVEQGTGKHYDPFLGWVRKEFHGKYVNTDAEGVRKTWNPMVAPGETVKKVFFFGGSTTWGVCARDDYTLPSLLSKKLNQGPERYLVTNYGDIGRTVTQELVHLTLLLKQGRIPDYVIFYDGVNDVWIGMENGRPGLIYNFEGFRKRLEGEGKMPWQVRLDRNLSRVKIYQFLKDLRGLWTPVKDEKPNPEAKPKLADAIIADYRKNLEVIRRLGQAYGFQCLFLWQPCLATTRNLTDAERQLDDWKEREKMAMYPLVYDKMKEFRFPGFHNLSGVLDDKKETLYFSWAHVTEEGNAIVADQIYRLFNGEFSGDRARGEGS